MPVEFSQAVQHWLRKAQDDVHWANASHKDGIYYGACFISQQAVEKALKSYLLVSAQHFPKIHDLVKLVQECKKIDKTFSQIEKKSTVLSTYYIETRYPDLTEFQEYNKAQAEQACAYADYIVQFIDKKISLIVNDEL